MSTNEEEAGRLLPRSGSPPAAAEVFPTSPPSDGAEAEAAFEALLRAYEPALRGLQDGEAADDTALATSIAERLFTEDAAVLHFSAEGRRILGPQDPWLACLPLVRCCWAFGWLVCRGCRDYRSLNHYLYRYWLCVRRAVGRGEPDRADFERLAELLGATYTEWLRGQEAQVKLDRGVFEEAVLRVDCCRDDSFTAALFERLSTPEAVAALLGRETFAAQVRLPYYWLCRCWLQAALRLGCCMACARTRDALRRCWIEYREALEGCVGPPRCELTAPVGCVAEAPYLEVKGLGVAIVGTAGGGFFSHYTLEWRMAEGGLVHELGKGCPDPYQWRSEGVVYPGGGSNGGSPVVGGTLGWLDTTFLPSHTYEIRVCVQTLRNERTCCCVQFNLFKIFVRIESVGAAYVGGGGPYDPTSPLVYQVPPASAPHHVPVGCCLTIRGSAWVGQCNDREIECFDLLYAPGLLPGPTQAGFDPTVYTTSLLPTPVCYTPPDVLEKRAQENQLTAHGSALTTRFVQVTEDLSYLFGLPAGTIVRKSWELRGFCWDSTTLPKCAAETPVRHRCASGEYTLLLSVRDTQGNHYYDTQHVLFDNMTLHASLGGLKGLKPCEPLSLKRFADGDPCAAPQPMEVLGIAYDEPIFPGDFTWPSNNFDHYELRIYKGCGGPVYQVPITPDLVHFHRDLWTGIENWAHGTAHVGLPASTAMCQCPPPPPHGALNGVLTLLDLRAFDAACAGQLQAPFAPPPGFALQRGECCGYTMILTARDKTVDDHGPGHCHYVQAPPCTICICNDLPVGGRGELGPAEGPVGLEALTPGGE